MSMGNSDDEQFRRLAGENWGELESKVGREAYEADIAMKKAHTELLLSQKEHGLAQGAADIEMSKAAIRFRDAQADLVAKFAATMHFTALAVVPVYIAVIIFLFRWALGLT